MGSAILIILAVLVYFLPVIVGWNKKDNTGSIFALNLFLGWTVIGWVVALVWALSDDKKQIVIENIQQPKSIADELEKLHKLKEAGVITQAEFDSQKEKLL